MEEKLFCCHSPEPSDITLKERAVDKIRKVARTHSEAVLIIAGQEEIDRNQKYKVSLTFDLIRLDNLVF